MGTMQIGHSSQMLLVMSKLMLHRQQIFSYLGKLESIGRGTPLLEPLFSSVFGVLCRGMYRPHNHVIMVGYKQTPLRLIIPVKRLNINEVIILQKLSQFF